ncbi:MAG: XTP/dITP diphosphatase [Bacillota bacterium]
MKKTIILATGNLHKVEEMKAVLEGLTFKIVSLKDYPEVNMPEEDRSTFAGNAAKKAEVVSQATGEIALADDSGLEVEALSGRPGVLSARYAGVNSNDEANNDLLLRELKDVPPEKRRAKFTCAIAVAVPGDQTYIVEESCSGLIINELRGSGGFGYDPLFYYEPAGLTFAEMTAEEKNKISHRGKALRCMRDLMGKIFS